MVHISRAMASKMSRFTVPVFRNDRSVLSVVPTRLANSVSPMPLARKNSSSRLAATALVIVDRSHFARLDLGCSA